MKVLQINTVYPYGSTGKIANGIYNQCKKNGIECKIAYRYYEADKYEDTVAVSSWLDCHIHNRLTRWTGMQGCFSYFYTRRFVKWIEDYQPDIIHIHNIHGSYLNYRVFFSYLKRINCNVVITMHDCWALTGLCPHFTSLNCEKWKTLCYRCPLVKCHYLNLFDPVRFLHKRKKAFLGDLNNLHIIANSNWTASMARESFLKDNSIEVIYNGVDLSVFKPTPSVIREKYSIRNDIYLVLGVAFGWSEKKGIDVFLKLFQLLDKSKYQIILVGTDKEVEDRLPSGIIAVRRTNNQEELATIYSAADVFVNPTREEAFGLVNVEANACGTPVVTFDTGGCPECISKLSGCIVPCNDVEGMATEIKSVCETNKYTSENCVRNAVRFDKNVSYRKYVDLYRRIAESD